MDFVRKYRRLLLVAVNVSIFHRGGEAFTRHGIFFMLDNCSKVLSNLNLCTSEASDAATLILGCVLLATFLKICLHMLHLHHLRLVCFKLIMVVMFWLLITELARLRQGYPIPEPTENMTETSTIDYENYESYISAFQNLNHCCCSVLLKNGTEILNSNNGSFPEDGEQNQEGCLSAGTACRRHTIALVGWIVLTVSFAIAIISKCAIEIAESLLDIDEQDVQIHRYRLNEDEANPPDEAAM